jgi:uncharacterized protein
MSITDLETGPVQAAERVEVIDVVRGFALFGVLLANLVWWTQDSPLSDQQKAALPTAAIDHVVRLLVGLFVDGKFYTLFSFLFGLGFAIQLERAARKGVDAVAIYRRRLLVLLAIGLVHNFLVWAGDILHMYALLGLLLLAVRRWSSSTLVVVGLVLAVLVPAVFRTLGAVLMSESEEKAIEEAARLEHLAALTGGGPLDVVVYNATNYVTFYTSWFFLPFLTSIVGRFLIGLLAGKERWFEEPGRHLALFRGLWRWGLVLGVLGQGLNAADEEKLLPKDLLPDWVYEPVVALASQVGLIGLAAAYLAWIVLAMRRPRGRRALAWLAPVGRMALTNYLTHSLVFLLVFYDFGLDLTAKVGASFCLGLALVLFATQAVASRWWLRRFHFGPAEWVWRSLTYRRRQPMRLDGGGAWSRT